MSRRKPSSLSTGGLLALAGILCLAGCGEELDARYGVRRGQSVNGTGVLYELLRRRGHYVTTRHFLSPSVKRRADCMFWFPQEYGVPPEENRKWLEEWLREEEGRVLVFVARDYDAESEYWKVIQKTALPEKLKEYKRRQQEAESFFDNELLGQPDRTACPWFVQRKRERPPRQPLPGETLSGSPRLVESVDAKKLEIPVNLGLEPAFEAEPLLIMDDEVLMTRQSFHADTGGESHLIVVVNGSFLLNYPLVHREHRKLAAAVLDEVESLAAEDSMQVVFLESWMGEWLTVSETDEAGGMQMSWDFFAVAPLSYIFLQLALVGIVFAFSRWPIFGRPQQEESEGLTDFGRHVEALGELLELSGDWEYAQKRVEQYQHTTKHETGRYEPQSAKPPTTSTEKEPASFPSKPSNL